MRAAWLVLLFLQPWATAVADPASIASARQVIEQCKTVERTGLGIEALTKACPQIGSAADTLGLDKLLPLGWRKQVDVFALADLAAGVQRYSTSAPHAAPEAAQLRAFANALAPQPKTASWLDRVLAWLRQWLESTGSKWQWWQNFHWPWHWHWPWPWHLTWSPGPSFWDRVLYTLGAVVVLAAIVVAFIEIRAARSPEGRRRLARILGIGASAALAEAGPSLEEIGSATADQQPVLALRLLVGALIRSQRLSRDRNLTCRELVTAARFDAPAQQAQFRNLALLAERALYAGHEQPSTSKSSVNAPRGRLDLEAVQQLYTALLAPQREPRSAT